MTHLGNVFLSFFFKDNWPGCLPEWNCTKYGLHIGLLRTQDALSRRKLINEIKKKSCKTTQPRHKVYAKTANFRTPELSSNSSRLGFGETPEQWVFFFSLRTTSKIQSSTHQAYRHKGRFFSTRRVKCADSQLENMFYPFSSENILFASEDVPFK